jgi:3-methylcrotonyl-CoA carboxylase alpha subunit
MSLQRALARGTAVDARATVAAYSTQQSDVPQTRALSSAVKNASTMSSSSSTSSTTSSHLSSASVSRHSVPQRRALSTAAAPSSVKKTDCGLYIDTSLPATFDKILIANRGEIACRVIRTCRQLGVKTVAVYSDADKHSQHVAMADEAYRIGTDAAADSYLRSDVILDVARRSGAQAIHPGYGFLSENAGFAAECHAAGVEFIGPPVGAITAMGSKSASKEIMLAADVPCVPGYHGDDQSAATLAAEAQRCGFPLMIKAVLGGGGKGMRIAETQGEFDAQLDACKRESMAAFKDDRVLLERYIKRSRHIEFQVFADKQGNAVHLFERDCSVQRRHQKVLEEAPAPGMSDALRKQMGDSAVAAAKAVGYVGAGTVEFIFDADTDDYFFMEMNTRLQVEHPVTEMIMRRDLVQWQLCAAAGHPVPATQAELNATTNIGHSIEARIYAEDPDNSFLPATGRLAHVRTPPTDGAGDVRVETGVVEGDDVSIFYDPMISKLVVWAPDRTAALNLMHSSLQQYQLVGPPNNIPFLERCVAHAEFRKGRVTTSFIPDNAAELLPAPASPTPTVLTIAALALLRKESLLADEAAEMSGDPTSPWATTASLRLNSANTRDVTFFQKHTDGDDVTTTEHAVTIAQRCVGAADDIVYTVTAGDGVAVDADLLDIDGIDNDDDALQCVRVRVGEQIHKATVVENEYNNEQEVHVFHNGERTRLSLATHVFGSGAGAGANGVVAPMAGKLIKVNVQSGDVVAKGDALVIMEAMKMEHVLKAPKDGVVDSVSFAVGDFVDGGKLVLSMVAEEEEE